MVRNWQKLLAEFIGTYLFVFVSAGAVCIDQELRSAGQTGLGLLGLALARGLAFAVLVFVLVQISGAHFNPAITIGAWVTRKMGSLLSLFYLISQCLGAIAAVYTLARFIPDSIWRPVAMGAPDLATGFSRTQGILFELLLTFFVVFVFFGAVAESKDFLARIGGFAAGLAVFLGTLIGSPYTGASMNPAATLGQAIISHHWTNHGVYWAGPLLGGVIGGWLYHTLFARDA
jgi:MIP family channel proteins